MLPLMGYSSRRAEGRARFPKWLLLSAPTDPVTSPCHSRFDDAGQRDGHGPMRSFAGFLRQDLDAVTAGLTHKWGNGVEGQVNRVKTLKRAIYGRESFRLLRTRINTQP